MITAPEMIDSAVPENLAPGRFVLWRPPVGAAVEFGAASLSVPLPQFPLPLIRAGLEQEVPTTAQIGQGVYDYLRQFPDCPGNDIYAGLLRDAFPHFLSDLAANAVMLDAKDVEPAYVLRKLTCLKILHLAEPGNTGLLRQLCRGFFELALDFSELADCRRHLLQAMRYGQELLRQVPEDPLALNLLAEIDVLFGDLPAAAAKLQHLRLVMAGEEPGGRIATRLAEISRLADAEFPLIDELESVAAAMQLHLAGDHRAATALLEWIEEQGRLFAVLPSANYYCLLAYCRQGCGDSPGAVAALCRALEIEPGHAAATAALAGE